MNKEIIYKEIQQIAEFHSINFDSNYMRCGRGFDCGEYCIDYSVVDGYILSAYDRDKRTYYYTSKNKEEFMYIVFKNLCKHNGFDYELKNRKSMKTHLDDLKNDTRKVAFEYSLKLLRSISYQWLERSIPEYEALLNRWRTDKNVFFDKNEMVFKVK